MITIKIKKDAENNHGAFIVQTYEGQEQVINSRWFRTESGARRWAEKQV